MTTARAFGALVFASAVMAACQRTSAWERTRSAYCDQVQQHADTGALEAASRELRAIALEPDDARPEACRTVERDLAVMAAELHGLFTAGLVVAAGRPRSTANDGVLVSTLPSEAVRRYDPSLCRLARYDAASLQVTEVKAAVDAALHEMLAECRAVGWRVPGGASARTVP